MKHPFAALAAVLVLTACATSETDEFRDRDPDGYRACEVWKDALNRGTPDDADAVAAGEIAKTAKTKAIRQTLEFAPEREGTWNEDGQPFLTIKVAEFEAACGDAGFEALQ